MKKIWGAFGPLFNQKGFFGMFDLATTAMQADAQDRTNWANERMMHDNMAWQEAMRSNAHQVEMADLKKAGLNPMLATGMKGAAMGSVSTAQHGTADMSGIGRAGANAIQTAMNIKEMKQKDADIRLSAEKAKESAAQQKLLTNSAKKVNAENEVIHKNMPAIEAASRLNKEESNFWGEAWEGMNRFFNGLYEDKYKSSSKDGFDSIINKWTPAVPDRKEGFK